MIRERSKNKWEIRIDYGRDPATGKRLQGYHTFEGRIRQAEAEERRLLALRDKREYIKPTQMTFSEWSAEWLGHHRDVDWTPRTLQGYEDLLRLHINPELGSLRLDQIAPLHIQRLISKKSQSGRADGEGALSPQTVLHIYRVVSQVFASAVALKVLGSSPCESLKAPNPGRKEAKALTKDEIGKLLTLVGDTPLRLPVTLALATAVRRGELLALTWKNVDFKNRRIRITQALSETKSGIAFKAPKNGKPRTLTIADSMLEELRQHRKQQHELRLRLGPAYHDHDLVFPGPSGSPWKPNLLSGAFARIAKKTGIEGLTFHTLRHTSITHLLLMGVPMKVVSVRAGHRNIGITADIYGHVLPGADENAAQEIEALLLSVAGIAA